MLGQSNWWVLDAEWAVSTKFALTCFREQDICCLDVPVDDIFRVEIDLEAGCGVKEQHDTQKADRCVQEATNPLTLSAIIEAICCSLNVFSGIAAMKSLIAPPPQNSIRIWWWERIQWNREENEGPIEV